MNGLKSTLTNSCHVSPEPTELLISDSLAATLAFQEKLLVSYCLLFLFYLFFNDLAFSVVELNSLDFALAQWT